MNVHVRRGVAEGLLLSRGGGLDGAGGLEDPELLDRATALGRVLFTQDDDLLREAKRRQKIGQRFAGIIYAHQLNITIGQSIADLELIAHASEPGEWINHSEYLPFK